MVPTPIWSEYKTTFSKSDTLLDYLFSKGYFPGVINMKYFKYDPFQNYKSSDLETSHIGILSPLYNQVVYMSEDQFIKMNKDLSGVTIDMLEYAFSDMKRNMIILKRGICMYTNPNGFDLCGISFLKLRGDEQMCRLDLVKILDDERIGWVPFTKEVPPSGPRIAEYDFFSDEPCTMKKLLGREPDLIDLTREPSTKRKIVNGWLS